MVQVLVAVSQDAAKGFITNVDEREARCFSSSTASSKLFLINIGHVHSGR